MSKITYKDSGVDIDEGNKLISKISNNRNLQFDLDKTLILWPDIGAV